MFAVLYRWKIKPGSEDAFRAAWTAMTEAIAKRSETGGSRLHRSADGEFVALRGVAEPGTRGGSGKATFGRPRSGRDDA
jgi:hypothetical protein